MIGKCSKAKWSNFVLKFLTLTDDDDLTSDFLFSHGNFLAGWLNMAVSYLKEI